MSEFKTCSICGGKFKILKRRHVIQTRHEQKSEIVFENLEVKECRTCGHIVIPESSEIMIDIIRQRVREELDEMVTQTPDSKRTLDKFKETVKKLIG